MLGLRSLLFEDLEITAPGMRILRFSLNRHLPETHWVRPHRHEFAQVLAYLSGSGWQSVESERIPVSAGRVIGVPAGVEHAFVKEKARSPLCLAIDFEAEPGTLSAVETRLLKAEALTEIRRGLSWLAKQREVRAPSGLHLREAGVVLQVAGLLVETLAVPENQALVAGRSAGSRFAGRVRRLLREHSPEEWKAGMIAVKLGIQRDHLNRLLKQECGLTLGQLIADHRLEAARRGLEQSGREIQEVANEVGILDPNYFARWFRRQTGLTPSTWRQRHGRA